MKEGDILKQVRDYLRWKGWLVYRIQQGLGCHRGMSDLICVRAGRVIFLEIKAPLGKLSDHQRKFQGEIEEAGCDYLWVSSLDQIRGFFGDKA
ncbi:MAG: VRR-NUC domain-containing protein [Pseudomonadota bacterium]